MKRCVTYLILLSCIEFLAGCIVNGTSDTESQFYELRQVGLEIQNYCIQESAFPGQVGKDGQVNIRKMYEKLTSSRFHAKNIWRDGELLDLWGNEIRIYAFNVDDVNTGDLKLLLISNGPNGKFNDGRGDDLIFLLGF